MSWWRGLASGAALAALLIGGEAIAVAAQPAAEPAPVASAPRFEDVSRAAGVAFRTPHAPEKRYILESVSGGVAVVDFDLDGWLDLFLVGSLTVDHARRAVASPSALYRNVGTKPGAALRFEERAAEAGVAATGWGVGVCAGDLDGNGYPDLYVTGVGRNWLFLNQDGERFVDATDSAGVRGGGWSTGCAMADPDRDGDVDLFVAHYLDMNLDRLPAFGRGELCRYRGVPVQCGPRGLPGLSDLYFRNLLADDAVAAKAGDNAAAATSTQPPNTATAVRRGLTFEEVAAEVGVGDAGRAFGLGATFVDVDGDGWQDLYVANDTMANFLYRNRGDGRFEEMAHLFGVAVTEDGKPQGSMGIAVGYLRGEDWPSLFVTNFSEEYNAFYRNHEGGFFSDESFRVGLAASSVRYVGWGTAFVDVDNDGRLDVPVINGHVYPQIDAIELEASAPYRQRGMLFQQRPDGRFEDVTAADGPLAELAVGRGLAVGDLDRDGRLDLVLSDLDAPARVLRNVTPRVGHWLIVRLVGHGLSSSALGARLRVRAGGVTHTRVVRSGTSYLSQHAFEQHVGLGSATQVDWVEVQWPDGSTSKHTEIGVDRVVELRQKP